ncbi:chorismate synthase [Eubacterium sp. 1001713B170207_170306_E7]|uniref:chorismate synthase n=1 Tax=Eubacterium sp. 1001713B170207_170306_E7 TaxID=2787097 RepID=UPI00189B2913|nr:chorismate synthase [Eubacterium sp. 1001713B170207_170306_E7]
MSSIWGNKIKVSVFGESHGAAIGATIDGLPSGVAVDLGEVETEMKRRAASSSRLATPRKEADEVEIVSGFFEGKTTGTPLTGIIRNGNTRSKDYARTKNLMRPGHADYSGWVRYDGFQDYRGGGHFSGRLTAPIVFAGAVAKAALAQLASEVKIGSRILSIGSVQDKKDLKAEEYAALHYENPLFPLYTETLEEPMKDEILDAIKDQDSVGGVIEGYVTGMPAGVGDPLFDSIESRLSALLFSVPAVKGVEFGLGFGITGLRGSAANDSFYMDGDRVRTVTNNNGGINGGITNGMPIVYRAAFKPTASIAQPQKTIDMAAKKDAEIEIQGRHDPCIVLRACPVVEAVTALCMLDFLV